MSILSDSMALYGREMAIFKANLRTNIIRMAMFPIVILLFFGFLGSAITNVPVVIVNYANNLQASQFISSLSSQNIMAVQSVTDQGSALAMLSAGQTDFVIVILPSFPSESGGKPSVQVYYNNVQISTTAEVLPAIQQRVAEFSSGNNFQSQQYLPSQSPASFTAATPVTGASGSYDDFLFSGVIGMIIVFNALFSVGISIIQDRQGGNIKSFLITPISKYSILLGRIFASAVQSIVSIGIVLIIGVLLGNSIAMGIVGIFWVVLLGMLLAICMTGISIIVASRMKNMTAFQIFGQTIGLPLWFISGGVFPVSSFPPVLQAISIFDPMTYALNGFRFAVLEGVYPLASIVTDVSVLVVFAVVTVTISMVLFKNTIE